MKKIVYLLSACVLGLGLTFTSCEMENEDENGNNNNNNNGGGDQTSDAALPFTVDLTYTSGSQTAKASLDISSLTAVSASQGDLTLCWQNNYGYVMTSPNGNLIKQLYDANTAPYSNTKSTTVQNLGSVSLDNYDELSELNSLSVSSGSIPDLAGKNQVQVQSGDVIAFQKGSVKGVAKVSGLSKVTKKITLKGYVNSSSSSTK
ncbi:MAG: hypothetical protein II937_14100 [Bacteroidales bacterium]|nr:hypothetical protein [Bacteroidales bacterium]